MFACVFGCAFVCVCDGDRLVNVCPFIKNDYLYVCLINCLQECLLLRLFVGLYACACL